MQVRVDINKVEIIQTEQVNSGEYNTRKIQFNIAENMQGLVLKALFTKDYKTYEVDIENDSCMIPWEVLKTDGNCELGVYAYSVNGEVLEIRYSPEPTKFYINAGSYKTEVENGEQPTPTRTEVLEGKIKELDNKKVDKKEGKGLSTNDFTNEFKTKLDNAGKQEDIDKLKAENQKQAEEIKALDKILPRAEASGENINIKNSAEYPISNISIDTNIKQDSREGYNEVNIEDYSDTGNLITSITSRKIVATSRLASDYAYEQVIYFDNVKLKTGITYTLRRIMKVISGTPKSITGQMELYIGGTWKKVIGNGSATGYDTKNTFTVDEDNTYRLRIKIANVNDVTEVFSVEFSDLMIYEGTTDKPYEQYGSMPSKEFPSEIKTPVGKQSFVSGNKNLLPFNLVTQDVNGTTLTINEDKSFTIKGTTIGGLASKSLEIGRVPLKSILDIPVTLSRGFINRDNNIGSFVSKIKDGKDATILNNAMNLDANSWTQHVTRTFTSSEWGSYDDLDLVVILFFPSLDGAKIDLEGYAQLEYGTVATDYVEHQSQTQDLDLTSELLGPIVDKEDGSYFENRYKIVDGKDINWYTVDNSSKSDTILRFNSTNDDSLTTMVSPTSPITLYSNLFKCEYILNAYTKECIAPHNSMTNHINMFIDKSRLVTEDIEGLKTFLEENSCKILYPLENPTYTKLTSEQQEQWNKIKKMHTYEGVTNIYTINDNGISPVINIKYVKSPKVVEENLQAQIDKLKNSIISMGGNV